MIRRCACAIAALTYFSACVALGQDFARPGGSDETGLGAEPQLAAAENPGLGQPPPQGNPLSRIPVNSLSATRERPLFSASRRPPLPPPTPPASIAKSSPPVEPERPPLTLQGTAIGKPRDIALVFDEAAKVSVRLHVGEAAEGWHLRSVDRRTVTSRKIASSWSSPSRRRAQRLRVRLLLRQRDPTNLTCGTTAGRVLKPAPTGFP